MKLQGDERGQQVASSSVSSVGDTTAIGMGGDGGSSWALGEGGKARATGNVSHVSQYSDNRASNGLVLGILALTVLAIVALVALVLSLAIAAIVGAGLSLVMVLAYRDIRVAPHRYRYEAQLARYEHERDMELLRYQLSQQRELESRLLIPAIEQRLLAPPPPPEQGESIEGEVLSYVALPK